MKEASPARLSGPQRANYNDKMLYIYTSGTTGLPKAVRFDIINKKHLFLILFFKISILYYK